VFQVTELSGLREQPLVLGAPAALAERVVDTAYMPVAGVAVVDGGLAAGAVAALELGGVEHSNLLRGDAFKIGVFSAEDKCYGKQEERRRVTKQLWRCDKTGTRWRVVDVKKM
jgi:hypothetical protein